MRSHINSFATEAQNKAESLAKMRTVRCRLLEASGGTFTCTPFNHPLQVDPGKVIVRWEASYLSASVDGEFAEKEDSLEGTKQRIKVVVIHSYISFHFKYMSNLITEHHDIISFRMQKLDSYPLAPMSLKIRASRMIRPLLIRTKYLLLAQQSLTLYSKQSQPRLNSP